MNRVEKNQKYWSIDSKFEPFCNIDQRLYVDALRWEVGNYFITEEEAEQFGKKCKDMAIARRKPE